MEDPHTSEIQRNIYNKVREDVNNAVIRNGEGMLYYSLARSFIIPSIQRMSSCKKFPNPIMNYPETAWMTSKSPFR
jgi:hypothetical protein